MMIAKQQLLPLLAGMELMHFAPAFSTKVQRALNVLGNLILPAIACYALAAPLVMGLYAKTARRHEPAVAA